jgi:uncharacterized membrane protein
MIVQDQERDVVPPSFTGSLRWWLMVVLALGGIGVAGYLSYAYVGNQSIVCGESQGCDLVAQSSYAWMFGLPIASFGFLAYIVLLVLLLVRRRVGENLEAYIPLAVFGISLVGVLFSAYLTYLELYVILAVCRWCVASALIMAALFFLSIFEMKSVAL